MKSAIQSVPSIFDFFIEPLGLVSKVLEKNGEAIAIEGLTGASRALFLTHFFKKTNASWGYF